MSLSDPRPANDAERIAVLRQLRLLDTLPEQVYDDLAFLASTICGTPISLVSLVDAERQWFKARIGVEYAETPRSEAFCAHAILTPDEVMTVSDAREDGRFVDNPHVTGAPYVRFYAGAPIVTDDGAALGTVCAIDTKPRTIDARQSYALKALARVAASLFQLRARTFAAEETLPR